jgi:hypothetical protein
MGGGIVVIALVALFVLPLALPSFFEIPLALSILAAGAPLGAAAAVLFAGPIVNLPSLLAVVPYVGWKVSALLASCLDHRFFGWARIALARKRAEKAPGHAGAIQLPAADRQFLQRFSLAQRAAIEQTGKGKTHFWLAAVA